MAEAETLMIAGRIDEGVNEVKESVVGVNIKLESARTEAQAVNRKVSLINTGDIPFFADPRIRAQPNSIRCNGGQRRDTSGV